MKKAITWLCLVALLLSLVSCSEVSDSKAQSEESPSQTVSASETEENETTDNHTEEDETPPQQEENPTEPDTPPENPAGGSSGSGSGSSSGSGSGSSSGSGSVSGGSSGSGSGSGAGTTTPPAPASDAANPLTWAKINAIPVANAGMSTDQLRQICVDFMKLQQTFSYIPSETFTVSSGTLEANTVYGGIPYSSSSYSSIYRWMYFLDEKTGVLDLSSVMELTGLGEQKIRSILGNQCSASAFWAWSRVSNSISWGGTNEMVLTHGCIPLGLWYLDPSIQNMHDYDKDDGIDTSVDTREVCKSFDKQTIMFYAYSQMKKADGVVYYYKTAGHVMMAQENAVVVRDPSGAINGDKSYVLFLEQQGAKIVLTQSNGKPIQTQNGVSKKYTFNQLYKSGYLPFTLKEFIGQDPVESAWASCSVNGNQTTVFSINRATVSSNYAISDCLVKLKKADGTVVGERVYLFVAGKLCRKSLSFAGDLLPTSWEAYADQGYTIELIVRVGNGQTFSVFQGKLVS